MAKRLTDTTKWDRENFRKLPAKAKLAWSYVTDKCDSSGLWHPDFDLLSFQIGMKITRDEFLEELGHKIVELPNGAWLIPSFIEFQYGLPLNPDCNPHKPVIATLRKYGIGFDKTSLTLPEGFTKGSTTLKDKDQDKNKDLDQDPDQSRQRTNSIPSELERIYRDYYPRKEGKSKGLSKLCREIKDIPSLEKFSAAVKAYAEQVRRDKTEPKFIKHFSTFVNEWTDYLDPLTGTHTGVKAKTALEIVAELDAREKARSHGI